MERPSGRVNGGHGRSVAALAVLVLLVMSLLPMCAPDGGGSEARAGGTSGERYEVTYVNEYPDEQYADNILNDWVGVGDSYTIAYYGTPVSEYNPQFWSTCITGEVVAKNGNYGEHTVEDWLTIRGYDSATRLYVFTGWSTDPDWFDSSSGLATDVIDPGEDLTDMMADGRLTLYATWSNPTGIARLSDIELGVPNYLDVDFSSGNKYTNLAILTKDLDYGGDFADTAAYWSVIGKYQNQFDFTIRSDVGKNFKLSVGGDEHEDWAAWTTYLYQYLLTDLVMDNLTLVGYGGGDSWLIKDDEPTYALFAAGQRLIIGANVDCVNKMNVYGGYYDAGDGEGTGDHVQKVTSTDLRIFSGDYYRVYGGSYGADLESTHVTIAGNGVRITHGLYGGSYDSSGGYRVESADVVIAGKLDGKVYGGSRIGTVDDAVVTLTNLATATSVQGDGEDGSATGNVTITLTGQSGVTGSVLGRQSGSSSSTITVVGIGGPAAVSAGTVGNASALVLGGSSVLTVGDFTNIGSLASYSSGTTPATEEDCSDPSVRNEVVMPHTMVLRIGDDRTGGTVNGYTLLTPSGGSFDGVVATGSASTDDSTSGFMLTDGRVKASVQTVGQLKQWGAVRFLSESVTLTFSSESGPADAEVTFQLRDDEILRHTGVDSALHIVDGTAFDQHGTAGAGGAFLDIRVSDAGQTASGFEVVTHTYSDGWVEDVRTYDGDLGGSLSVSSGILNPGDVATGDAGSVILSFDVVSGGVTVGYAELEIVVVVLPSLADDPGVVVYVVTVGQDAFGTTVDVELGGLGLGTTFSASVNGVTVSITYDPLVGLDIPSSLEGTGLIGLSSEDGDSILLLIAIGSLDDVPAAGVLTL